jgi:hypothetical protein
MGKTSFDDFTDADWETFFTTFDAEYAQSLRGYENAVQLSWDKVKDYVKGAIDEIESAD